MAQQPQQQAIPADQLLPVENPFIVPADLKYIPRFLKIVGYEGIVDKVSAFYTKNLAQPWETMFKVFNGCLTTRTNGHDQTKINILHIFHAMINQVHVDYAGLLCFTSPFLQDRSTEYHSILRRVPLGSVYTTGNVTVRGMLSPSELLTDEICATKEYKAYEEKFVRYSEESLKVTSKKKKPSTTPIPPPSDDRKQDELAKATILSLTMHKTTLAAEAQENVAIVKKKILEEDIDNMIDGEDENSYASAFAASLFQDEEDTNDVEKQKKDDEKNDAEKNDDNDYDDDNALVRNKVSGSLDTRNEHMQTPISSPLRSLRTE
ncbi:hypothetical protein Tco_0298956 [Tanacetum coccineum]